MQRICSKDTIPEQKVMQELKRRKIYFVKYVTSIPGKPDIVYRRKKIVVFRDSNFWHRHPKRFIMPITNHDYWSKKLPKTGTGK